MPGEHASSGFADVNGTRLYYETAGEGEPLVLIHAGIADHTMWDAQFDALARHFRVVAYDLRGYGQSPIPDEPFAHYRDLEALMKHLGIARAHLVGASIGGKTAVNLALARPDMVESLVLVGAAVEGRSITSPELTEQWTEVDEAIGKGDFDRAADIEMQIWVAGPKRSVEAVEPAVREKARAMLLQSYKTLAGSEATEQPLEPVAAARLREVRVPTLVVVGDEDVPGILDVADLLAREIPGARKVLMPATAHLPNMEKPEEFTRIALDFLKGLP
jgi:pimeloyl-ACP methyl ester carboxylesterase